MPKDLDLSIDKTSLDEEWVNQPALYFEWARYAADCSGALDKAKTALDLVKAEVEKEIRDDPGAYELAKATEASVAAAVLTQPEYKAAVKAVNVARHDLAVANAAVNALEHRKRSLSLLVELWIREYYTADATPRPRSAEAEEFGKKAARTRVRRRVDADEVERDDDE